MTRNAGSLDAVRAARLNDQHVPPHPLYNFARIPHTILQCLTGEADTPLPDTVLGDLPRAYDKVIVLLVDAFGWRFYEQYCQRSAFLSRFEARGTVSMLTSQFPSTTSAHLPTIHTGLPVGQTGIYEWFYYEPLADTIISPLLYTTAEKYRRGTLKVEPERLFPNETIYAQLAARGVQSTVLQHKAYTPSPFTSVVFAGAEVKPFTTLSEGLVNLALAIERPGKQYTLLYWDAVDTMGHVYGLNTPQFDAEVEATLSAFERLHERLADTLDNALLLVTADHGQIETTPEAVVLINERAPWLLPMLRKDAKRQALMPAGSSRDCFLYVRDEFVDEAALRLANELGDVADVVRVADLIERGYFGTPSPRFMERMASLVVLPHPHELVWWHDPLGRFVQTVRGHHGGLTPQEMEIPLLALAY